MYIYICPQWVTPNGQPKRFNKFNKSIIALMKYINFTVKVFIKV